MCPMSRQRARRLPRPREFGQDLALDDDGRIVAVGYTANGGDTQFALMRANP